MIEFFINIEVFEGEHRDKEVLWIRMPNLTSYKLFLKQNIPSAKWSNSRKMWYVSDAIFNRKFLKIQLKQYNGYSLLKKIHDINKSQLTRYIDQLRLKAYSESTIKTYAVEFAQWLYILNDFSVLETNHEQLRSYMLYCIKDLKLSENQIHSRLNALKFYYEKVLMRETFFFEIPRPKKNSALPKVLSTKEIKRLFEVTSNLKHLMILKMGYGLGLRVSEITNLKIANIDSNRMIVHIQGAKGKKDRYVPLPFTILDELRIYYKQFKPKVYLFETKPENAISTRTVQLIFKTSKEKANIIKNVGIHGLRHSYATHLLEYGTDMSIIQKLLGHNNVKTTEVYAKVTNTIFNKLRSPLDEL